MSKQSLLISLFLLLPAMVAAQTESLANAQITQMTKAGLSPEIILKKISSSPSSFDVSTDELIELKKAGVDNAVISAMMKRTSTSFRPLPPENVRQLVLNANTIALQKASLNPSRQALENELLKRPDWQALNLTIEQYRDNADLYVDIGFVPLSLFTHRYVYRIYDRRSGSVLAAGETTSWGSLAENLAGHITRSLAALRN